MHQGHLQKLTSRVLQNDVSKTLYSCHIWRNGCILLGFTKGHVHLVRQRAPYDVKGWEGEKGAEGFPPGSRLFELLLSRVSLDSYILTFGAQHLGLLRVYAGTER